MFVCVCDTERKKERKIYITDNSIAVHAHIEIKSRDATKYEKNLFFKLTNEK